MGKSHSRLRPLLCDISNKSCHSRRPEKGIFDVLAKKACLNDRVFSHQSFVQLFEVRSHEQVALQYKQGLYRVLNTFNPDDILIVLKMLEVVN